MIFDMGRGCAESAAEFAGVLVGPQMVPDGQKMITEDEAASRLSVAIAGFEKTTHELETTIKLLRGEVEYWRTRAHARDAERQTDENPGEARRHDNQHQHGGVP